MLQCYFPEEEGSYSIGRISLVRIVFDDKSTVHLWLMVFFVSILLKEIYVRTHTHMLTLIAAIYIFDVLIEEKECTI